MSKVTVKNMPRLRLSDLLKRRKMTLEGFLQDSGVQTYEALVNRCNRLGCLPPLREEYRQLRPVIVNSPQDGVVVLEAPPLIEESTGKNLDLPVEDEQRMVNASDALDSDGGTMQDVAPMPTQGSRKARKPKKESQPLE